MCPCWVPCLPAKLSPPLPPPPPVTAWQVPAEEGKAEERGQEGMGGEEWLILRQRQEGGHEDPVTTIAFPYCGMGEVPSADAFPSTGRGEWILTMHPTSKWHWTPMSISQIKWLHGLDPGLRSVCWPLGQMTSRSYLVHVYTWAELFMGHPSEKLCSIRKNSLMW